MQPQDIIDTVQRARFLIAAQLLADTKERLNVMTQAEWNTMLATPTPRATRSPQLAAAVRGELYLAQAQHMHAMRNSPETTSNAPE